MYRYLATILKEEQYETEHIEKNPGLSAGAGTFLFAGGGCGRRFPSGTACPAVITQEQVVIEPTSVSYQQGDTIRTALKNSGHSFEGIDTGFVSAIDGTADNYTLFYDQGATIWTRRRIPSR